MFLCHNFYPFHSDSEKNFFKLIISNHEQSIITYAQCYYKARKQILRQLCAPSHTGNISLRHCCFSSHLVVSSASSRPISSELNDFVVPNSRVPSCLISSSRHFLEPEAPGCSFLLESEDEPTAASSNQSRTSLFHRVVQIKQYG